MSLKETSTVIVRSSPISIGFGGLLTIAFIVLKLCGVIAWSWWWVLAPIWIPPAIAIALIVLTLGFGLLVLCVVGLVAGAAWAFKRH